jgi:tetratricopeptide (TPR) repeat protein
LVAPVLVALAGFVLGAGPLTALTGGPGSVARPVAAPERVMPAVSRATPQDGGDLRATTVNAAAARPDGRLAELFAELRAAEDAGAATKIENEIWEYWADADEAVVTLLFEQGVEAMERNALRVAHRKLNAAVAHRPDFAEAFNQRAALRYRLDDITGAVEDLYMVLYLEPRHFGALMGLANILEEYGSEERALTAMERAREINPHIPRIDERIERLELQVRGLDL